VAGNALSGFQGAVIFQKIRDAAGMSEANSEPADPDVALRQEIATFVEKTGIAEGLLLNAWYRGISILEI
jgi:hypothetical protein